MKEMVPGTKRVSGNHSIKTITGRHGMTGKSSAWSGSLNVT